MAATPAAGCADVTGTSCTATGLAPATTYYVTVRSLDTGVLSTSPSSQASTRTVAAPTGLAASVATSAVSVTWSALAGVSATYDVYMGTSSGAETYTTPVPGCADLTATACTVTGLSGGTYDFTVVASGSGFRTTPSAQAAATVGGTGGGLEPLGAGHHLGADGDPGRHLAGEGRLADGDERRPELVGLGHQGVDRALGGQSDHGEPVGVGLDHLDGLRADRPGRPDQADRLALRVALGHRRAPGHPRWKARTR